MRLQSLEINPFLFRILPRPSANSVALLLGSCGSSNGLRLVESRMNPQPPEKIATFETLLPVLMNWSPDGRSLAYAQSEIFHVHQKDRTESVFSSGQVRQLAWDKNSTLWGLSQDRLWQSSSTRGFAPETVFDGVLTACISPCIAALRRTGGAFQISHYQGAGEPQKFPWPLSIHMRPALRGTPDGSGVLAYAEEPCGAARVRCEIAHLSFATGAATLLFAGELASGLGFPSIHWTAGGNDSVFFAAELDEYTRVFRVDLSGRGPQPISPAGFEITAFAVAGQQKFLAMIGTPFAKDPNLTENWLLVKDIREGHCLVVSKGVNSQPAWDRASGSLIYTHATSVLDSELRICGMDSKTALPSFEDAMNGPAESPAQAAPALFLLRTQKLPFALIHLQGPHRRFLNGPQSTFFHHALLALLERFAAEGYLVSCLNGPGSTGRGRSYREGSKSWLQDTITLLENHIRELKASGFERIGIVAGSLGALPALYYLAQHALAAGVLVSPVCDPRIPALKGWEHVFDHWANITTIEDLARAIHTPLLVLHGVEDEMSPIEQSSRLVANLGQSVCYEYMTLPNEAHIFRRPASWEKGLAAAYGFLKRHLQPL